MVEHILHPLHLKDLVQRWLKEDTPNFDYGGSVIGDKQTTASILGKSEGILAGVPFATAVLKELECQVEWRLSDGDRIDPVVKIGTVRGTARNVLLAERVILNCLARASGVATTTNRIKTRLEELGWEGTLASTRKTTPLFRMVEKYSVLVGGGCPHRYDLSSMIMLKDNHIAVAGSITKAVEAARAVGGFPLKIEVECQSEDDAVEACEAKCDIILLDNFLPGDAKEIATRIKKDYPSILIEVSGGITEANITEFAGLAIDIISSSTLVQGYPVVDISMKIKCEHENK